MTFQSRRNSANKDLRLLCALLLSVPLVFASACGGGGSSTPPVSPTITSVSVSCLPTSISTAQTSTCTANVQGTGSYSSAVTWAATGGTINAGGVFTPSGVGTASITATSTQNTSKTGSTSVIVSAVAPTITSVSVSCLPASISTAQTSTCTANVQGTGSYSSAVTWTATGGTVTSGGVFTPSGVGPASVTATSTQDTSNFGTATVTVTVNQVVPTITWATPGAIASGAALSTTQLNATASVSGSFVYNPPAGTVFNSGSYTLSVSFTPTDSVNYASASASATQKVADVTKLVMFAAPAAGTSGTGAWQVSAGAADADGDLLVSAPITITTTDGDISPAQGLTDQTGVLTATLMAPSSYSGQTVAVSATNGKVSSAVNIDFTALPNSASAAVRNRLRAASVNLNGMSSSDTTSGISVTPLIVASSIESGTDNPFSVPDPCFIQSALSTVPVACQSVFSQKNLQYKNSELSKVVCSASDALNNIAGVSSCAGTTAVILGCALTVSGVGAPIGAGVCTVGLANPEGLTAATTECASWILGNLAKTPNPNDKLTYDMSALPAGSDPPSITDLIGVKCDELDVQGKLSDAQISVLPETVTLALGGHNQFGRRRSPFQA